MGWVLVPEEEEIEVREYDCVELLLSPTTTQVLSIRVAISRNINFIGPSRRREKVSIKSKECPFKYKASECTNSWFGRSNQSKNMLLKS